MPDEDFPIDIQGEGPSLDAASILQSQHSADWAQKFKGGANNLMTRKRHQADVAENLATQQAAQEAYQRNLIQTDKVAQDFYFRSEKLDMDREFGKARLEERAQKFEHEKEMFPVTIAARKAATIAAMGRTEAMAKADLWKEELHAQKAKDTVGFTEYVRQSGHKRGTPEFAETLADARTKFPAMDHVLFQDVWKTHAGSELEPDEAMKRFEAARKALPGETVSGKLPGGITVTHRPEPDTTAKDQTRLSARLSRLESLRMGKPEEKLSADQKAYLDKEIGKIEAHLSGAGETSPTTAAAPASAPGAPTAPAKTVWKMKDGVKWEFDAETKKPTGKYIKGQ